MNKLRRFFILILSLLLLCSCTKSKDSSFNITFMDVGQGDSALIECDGHYMLIDGGDSSSSSQDKVYNTLQKNGVTSLDILALSHLHEDHIGGLERALTYTNSIGLVISNTDHPDNPTETFRKIQHALSLNGSSIVVPPVGKKYNLGSATVEVVDVASDTGNDSLVLMITYGKTKFLFTGDIESKGQERLINKYRNDKDEPYEIDLIKMPHHGAFNDTSGTGNKLYEFLRTFMPKYAIISVGKNNPYGHPEQRTLDLLDSLKDQGLQAFYRTDKDGDIIVKSDGKTLYVQP